MDVSMLAALLRSVNARML